MMSHETEAPSIAGGLGGEVHTTHAMMYARAMFGCEETTDVSLYTDGFTAFAATCKEIHFANCIKNGGRHRQAWRKF